ncbi:phosphoglycerol transferase MdoB-like AlkP superfamily enzyme [Planomicrobium stackebrandtii]|uniref:Phosphoglycerol transferase MdoB-like AlkP superfamily enzyme n=1 Tax=Planomicrobium stackebrandtii TaxID=253160 RepID=A0ABU0GXE9_9BACL|nr:LTA synthase family protein [Planomicrobium stackebrandtii]MDQ0430051.1 phosphoglycerol transferase MdoB-like AlkP superfamily enzyme [Planomicrobium stackebrandtii]
MLKKEWPKHSILAIAIIATWLKTYIVYKTSFSITIDNLLQEFILFINPLSMLLFIYGISLFFKSEKSKNRYLIAVAIVTSIILYGNVAFYRFFSDFITLPVLFQTENFGDLGSSAAASIFWTDLLYFADVAIILLAIKFVNVKSLAAVSSSAHRKAYYVLALAVLFFNLGLAEAERPQLLTRSFDREMLVKNLGMYNYHLYDVYIQSKSQAQRALADGSELVEANNYVRANQIEPSEEMKGVAEGRNLIVVTLESLQSFTINGEMNGQTITPFLNSLTEDEDTIYFENFYHQTGLGKTSDSEFLLENSLYPLSGGAVFFTHSGNTYNSMAESLGNKGYSTNVQHANTKSFWNRDIMYESMNIDEFYDIESFEVGEGEAVNWGMKDIPFLEQSVEHMTEMEQPFYSRLLTLTNHHPFTLDEQDKSIPEFDSNSGTLNRYFQTSRYLDESIEVFFEELKEKGLYENSIIVMYGDHYGISENHNEAMSQYLGEEVTDFTSAELQKVPFFVHIPGYGEGHVNEEVGGQIDMRPTIMNLMGIDTSKDIQFGGDLFSEEHEEFVPFRDGRFVTDKVVYAGNVCYDKETGEPTEEELCAPYIEQAFTELEYSESIINGDLLRFYDEEDGQLTTIPEGDLEQ